MSGSPFATSTLRSLSTRRRSAFPSRTGTPRRAKAWRKRWDKSASRGEGVHHVGYGVADVRAALDALKGHDIRLIDEHPLPGSRGASIAFIHPKSVGGVLVELVQE